jgi:hypothetical protein
MRKTQENAYVVHVPTIQTTDKNNVNNIKMDLKEVGWGSMDWIYLAQDRDRWRALVSAVMNLRGA